MVQVLVKFEGLFILVPLLAVGAFIPGVVWMTLSRRASGPDHGRRRYDRSMVVPAEGSGSGPWMRRAYSLHLVKVERFDQIFMVYLDMCVEPVTSRDLADLIFEGTGDPSIARRTQLWTASAESRNLVNSGDQALAYRTFRLSPCGREALRKMIS